MKTKLLTLFPICLCLCAKAQAQAPAFPVIYPSTGNTVTSGSFMAILWTPPTNVANVRITILTNGLNGMLVHPSVPNSGMYYGWLAPYVGEVTNQWRVSISGCNTQNVCGETIGGYFTFVSSPPMPPRIAIKKVGQEIHVNCVGSCGFANYIQGSTNLITWRDLSGPFVGYGAGDFLFSAVIPHAVGTNMFFRAVTRFGQ